MNKKIWVISAAAIVIVIIAAGAVYFTVRSREGNVSETTSQTGGSLRSVEFMTAEDKEKFQLLPES